MQVGGNSFIGELSDLVEMRPLQVVSCFTSWFKTAIKHCGRSNAHGTGDNIFMSLICGDDADIVVAW